MAINKNYENEPMWPVFLKWDILSELENHVNIENYHGSTQDVENSNSICDKFIRNKVVDQDWFDDRLKATVVERYVFLLEELIRYQVKNGQ